MIWHSLDIIILPVIWHVNTFMISSVPFGIFTLCVNKRLLTNFDFHKFMNTGKSLRLWISQIDWHLVKDCLFCNLYFTLVYFIVLQKSFMQFVHIAVQLVIENVVSH